MVDNKFIDLQGYFVQRTINEFPMGIKSILSRIYEDILEGNTKGKVPLDIGSSITTGNINIIPARFKGECCNILVTICYDGDNFDERFRNFLDHASITCAGINRELFLFTTQWNSAIINKYLGYLDSLRRNGVDINLIYVTNKGIVLMPV